MSDRLALVTGATGGIGHAVADALAVDHELISHDRPGSAGEKPSVVADLTDPGAVDELVAAVGDRPLDLLVLAHGIALPAPLADLTAASVKRIMTVNFAAMADLVEALTPALEQARGVAVAVASQAGMTGEPNFAAYAASKFALVGWARGAATELASRGVRLRLTCPGCVDTPMLRGAIQRWATKSGEDPAAALNARIAQIPCGRLAAPTEIAAGIRYLATLHTTDLIVFNHSGGETFTR